MSAILALRELTVRFLGLVAVNTLSFNVPPGGVYSVIGPNGAGKTTVFNAVTGVCQVTGGEIVFQGRKLEQALTAARILLFLLIGLVSGVCLTVLVNVELLWSTVITANYVYRKPFPWTHAATAASAWVRDAPLSATVGVLLIGFVIGGAGAWTIWQRARRRPDVVAREGVTRTFQNIRLFQQLTALENVLAAVDVRRPVGLAACLFHGPAFRRTQRSAVAQARELLAFVGLAGEEESLARNLSYGHQRRLEIARALAGEPALLLLDEPAAGMNPAESQELVGLIRHIHERNITVMLIEHHMRLVMAISDRIAVLDYGNMIAEGTPQEVRSNPAVVKAYLGES